MSYICECGGDEFEADGDKFQYCVGCGKPHPDNDKDPLDFDPVYSSDLEE